MQRSIIAQSFYLKRIETRSEAQRAHPNSEYMRDLQLACIKEADSFMKLLEETNTSE